MDYKVFFRLNHFIIAFFLMAAPVFGQTKKFDGYFISFRERVFYGDDSWDTKSMLIYAGSDSTESAKVLQQLVNADSLVLQEFQAMEKIFFDENTIVSFCFNTDNEDYRKAAFQSGRKIDSLLNTYPLWRRYEIQSRENISVSLCLIKLSLTAVSVMLRNGDDCCGTWQMDAKGQLYFLMDRKNAVEGFVPVLIPR